MRTGTARTAYDWLHDGRRDRGREWRPSSRARRPTWRAVRLQLTPRQSGRLRVRFALAGWPPPRRLPLATAERAPPDWRPADIWYPGHAAVRDRSATARGNRAELSLSSAPEGRGITLAQASSVEWPRGLPRASARGRADGDTASVEIAFDAAAGRTYDFTHLVSLAWDSGGGPLDLARRRVAEARRRGYACHGERQRPGLGPPLGDGHPRRGQSRPPAGGALDAVLPARQRRFGDGDGHPAHGTLERRLLRARVLGLGHVDVSLPAPDASRRGTVAGLVSGSDAAGGSGQRGVQRLPRGDVSLGSR